MYLLALTIGTYTFHYRVSTGVSPTALAVIRTRARKKLVPAILAQALVRFANTLFAVNTYRRPKKLMQTLQSKAAGLSRFCRIHAGNYTAFFSSNKYLYSTVAVGCSQPNHSV
jgi:hypothetical protein